MASSRATSAAAAVSLSVRLRSSHLNQIFFCPVGFSRSKSLPLLPPCLALDASVKSVSAKGEMEKENKLWGGRFEEGVHESVERFTESVSFEAEELWVHDIRGSMAHANMLAAQGLVTEGERDLIIEGLCKIKEMIESGKFVWRKDREDVHMNIEASLTDMIGEPAKKLHTARSRNDQVVTDLRLWCRDAIDRILIQIKQLQVGS